jgi:nitrogen regulatory protein PII
LNFTKTTKQFLAMKKIVAIIRSSKFEEVKDSLNQIGINFFTFMEVKGYGKQKGEHVVYRGAEYDVGYIARLQLEIFATNEKAPEAVQAIRNAAHTGEIGDGKICVSNIEELVSVRTGQQNESAL